MSNLKKRILLVDDETDLLETLESILKEKFDVVLAINGEEALSKYNQEAFDVVLTDIQMPVMNGLTLIQNIRKVDKFIPIVILTGYGDKESAVEALRLGVFDFVDKPCDYADLLNGVLAAAELSESLKKIDDSKDFTDKKKEMMKFLAAARSRKVS